MRSPDHFEAGVTGWYFSRFDYAQYLVLRPKVRSATSPQDFQLLAQGPETRAIAEAYEVGDVVLECARSAFLQAVCCVGEPILLDRALARVLSEIARLPEGEAAAELLTAALAGGKNMERWMLPSAGMVSFFKPEEVVFLSNAYAPIMHRIRYRRRRYRYKWWRAFVAFCRNLFDRGPRAEDLLVPLGGLIVDAVKREEGIAIVAV